MPDSIIETSHLAEAMRGVVERLPLRISGAVIAARLQDACTTVTPQSVKSCAELLSQVGFITQARVLLDALARINPKQPAALAALAQIAMRRKAWPVALARWDALIADFTRQRNAYWLVSRARVLNELDRHSEADAALNDGADQYGDQPVIHIARAQIAAQRGLTAEALDRWNDVLARFPQHASVPFLEISRADALLRLGRAAAAEASLRRSIEADPSLVMATLALMRLLKLTDRANEGLKEWESGIFADAAVPEAIGLKIRYLIHLQRFEDAEREFLSGVQNIAGLETIQQLVEMPPRLFQGSRRAEMQTVLLNRLDELSDSVAEEDVAPFQMARARLKLALGDHSGFLAAAHQVEDWNDHPKLYRDLRNVVGALTEPGFPDFEKPKIFGIGLSKTGTSSLAAALNALGFSTPHWTNPLTNHLIADCDLHLFDGFTDIPVCGSFEKYFDMFPNAKFIYTTRPIDSWVISFVKHWRRIWCIGDLDDLTQAIRNKARLDYGDYFRDMNLELFFKFPTIVDGYNAYDRRVRRFFIDKPKHRLLEFSVFEGNGWPELCEFLGVDAPQMPFPRENARPDYDT